MTRWQPSPFLQASAVIHAGAAAGLFLLPPAGRWPSAPWRPTTSPSRWPACCPAMALGPNITRLPAAAAARGEVVLSIDDGPDPDVHPKVLDQLAAANAHATFFASAAERPPIRHWHARSSPPATPSKTNSEHHWKRFSDPWPRPHGTRNQHRSGNADAHHRLRTALLPAAGRPAQPFPRPRADPPRAGASPRGPAAYDTRVGDPQRILARLGNGLAGGDILLLHDGNAARSPAGTAVILRGPATLAGEAPCRRAHAGNALSIA